MHDTTCVYFGLSTHVRGGEGISRKVGDLVTELIGRRRGKESILAFEGMADRKCRPTPVAMVRQVSWLYSIVQEEGVSPLLRP